MSGERFPARWMNFNWDAKGEPMERSKDGSKARFTGVVKHFNNNLGFGFISPDDGGEDVFIHHRNIIKSDGEWSILIPRQSVDYGLAKGYKGHKGFQAVDVKIIGEGARHLPAPGRVGSKREEGLDSRWQQLLSATSREVQEPRRPRVGRRKPY